MRIHPLAAAAALTVLLTGCGAAAETAPITGASGPANYLGYRYPPPPPTPTGVLDPGVVADLDGLWTSIEAGSIEVAPLERLGEADDPRLGWLLADLLRFTSGAVADAAVDAFEAIANVDIGADPAAARSPWGSITDHLIAWDTPAPPGYIDYKQRLFHLVEPRWDPFFTDPDATIDWRLVSWGGVFIDDRELGEGEPCPRGCIPALDDPAVTRAEEGSWYPDDAVVFGVVINGAARAYPKNIMEIHEMVNDTLGGRRIAIPYCTLCGSAQAYFTDDLAESIERPLLRTTGLLVRSNKIMYDLRSFSAFDTFTGEAVSGPLREAGITLNQTAVVTSTWGDWKRAHPDTTIVAEDGGIGRTYPADPLRDRDDNGPIFPIGDIDPRLPAQEQVLGVITADGTAVAFPVAPSRRAVDLGEDVTLAGITVVPDGSGLRATENGKQTAAHQAFWFAWSQFHPDTLLWQEAPLS